jgi:methionyl-tRNA synthetase
MNEEQQAPIEEIKKEAYISIDDFAKVKARIGKVLVAEAVPDSDKLIRFELDFGDAEPRQILSAIREWYPEPEALVGKQLLFVVNLAPRKIRGLESNGMLMAVDGLDGAPVFIVPESLVAPGSTVR